MTKTTTKSIRIKDRRIRYSVRLSRSATEARIKINRDGVEVIVPQGAQNGKAAEFLRANSSWLPSILPSKKDLKCGLLEDSITSGNETSCGLNDTAQKSVD